MEPPPLSLDVKRLTPTTLVPGVPVNAGPVPSAPSAPALPPLPASFTLSPTSNYPAPFGTACLGERLSASVCLANSSPSPVRGVKMMLEVQTSTARIRLGEAVHGGRAEEVHDPAAAERRPWDALPCLDVGDGLALDVAHDIAELGQHILICSVAWETEQGRRTFQRFMKFTVAAPLAIKTRVHTPTNANTTLSAQKRGEIYLEVLMQNTAPHALAFGSVYLDPVPGLLAKALGEMKAVDAENAVVEEMDEDGPSLLPGDTAQRLFLITPVPDEDEDEDNTPLSASKLPLSSFLPFYATGTVLPIGKLAISWVGGVYREPGHFQTLTLNRRTPVAPVSPPSRPSSVVGVPQSLRSSMSRPPAGWEYDLTLSGERSVPLEEEAEFTLRLGVRSPPVTDAVGASTPPPPLQLGLQILSPPAPSVEKALPPPPPNPTVAVLPPSRTSTPLRPSSPAPSAASRTFSPAPPSRPMTPVREQLRHAAVSHIASPSPAPSSPGLPPSPVVPASATAWPPSPTVERPPPPLAKRLVGAVLAPPAAPAGRVLALGNSLLLPESGEWKLVRERPGTTYAAEAPGTTTHRRWEMCVEGTVKFLGLSEGLAELGGVRVLNLGDKAVGREWELGEVWVEG